MLIKPECVICLYKASLGAIREVTSDEQTVKDLMSEIVQLTAPRGVDWSLISSQLLETILRTITATLGNTDPFQLVKERQNRRGMELYPMLRTLVAESEDPLHTAVNLAILGNSLDVMWSEGSVDVEPIITERLKTPVEEAYYLELKRSLEKARLVMYFADNCGEVIFDRVLIETLREINDPEVICVVRSEPTLNDVTRTEAGAVGLDEVSTVVENGIDGPMPGTILSRCSEEVRRLVQEADLIIAKGGGNFDTMDEEKMLGDNTFFMLMCKCVPYRDLFRTELYYPILRSSRFREHG
jgi:uncharacterized protein with ATP-grasp and redox domains